MEDLHDLTKQILSQGYLMSLATIDEGGPWVSDVIYVFDDNFNLYWMSKKSTRHSQAIRSHSAVAATITLPAGPTKADGGLQIAGVASELSGDNLEIGSLHRRKRGKTAPDRLGEILDDDEAWYCLRPQLIQIIYQPAWGFKKQSLTFDVTDNSCKEFSIE